MTHDWSPKHTFIQGKRIPIRTKLRPLAVLRFRCGKNEEDQPGDYWFWIAHNGERALTKRCLKGTDPGEPFRRMIETEELRWEIAASAKVLLPEDREGVRGWLNEPGKEKDAECAEGEVCWIGDTAYRVVRTTEGVFDLVTEKTSAE